MQDRVADAFFSICLAPVMLATDTGVGFELVGSLTVPLSLAGSAVGKVTHAAIEEWFVLISVTMRQDFSFAVLKLLSTRLAG